MTTEQKMKLWIHEMSQGGNVYKNVSYGPADYQEVNIPVLLIVGLCMWWYLRKEGLI